MKRGRWIACLLLLAVCRLKRPVRNMLPSLQPFRSAGPRRLTGDEERSGAIDSVR
ncbi:MAG: hypothetical protein ACLUZZ_05375 [Alistipes inops]